MKYYIICGEASGDLHGANLIKAIKTLDNDAEFRVWGGDLMEAEGVVNFNHIKERAFMGFVEVIKNLFTIKKFIALAKRDISEYKPDRLIFIDYPGFNLRIAEWAHEQGLETHYYISPKVWAWNTKRALKIKRIIDHLYVIFPFEVDFYKQYHYKVHYVGNPLADAIEEFEPDAGFETRNGLNDKPVIALLPGSRKQEILKKLPIMLDALKSFDNYQIIIAGAPSLERSFYDSLISNNVKIVFGKTYDLLSNSEAAVVTSGTATLETALLGIPEVVCYKGSSISYHIAKRLIKIQYISLVNLIMNREVVKELIQMECTSENIEKELKTLLLGGSNRKKMLKDFAEMEKILGKGGASEKVAQSLLKTIQA